MGLFTLPRCSLLAAALRIQVETPSHQREARSPVAGSCLNSVQNVVATLLLSPLSVSPEHLTYLSVASEMHFDPVALDYYLLMYLAHLNFACFGRITRCFDYKLCWLQMELLVGLSTILKVLAFKLQSDYLFLKSLRSCFAQVTWSSCLLLVLSQTSSEHSKVLDFNLALIQASTFNHTHLARLNVEHIMGSSLALEPFQEALRHFHLACLLNYEEGLHSSFVEEVHRKEAVSSHQRIQSRMGQDQGEVASRPLMEVHRGKE